MYLGDYLEDETIYLMFNTFTSNDPSASSTITEFINTDVHIYKDNGTTQRNNAAGIVVSKDFDGITGFHQIAIDTSDDTVGGFWVTGSDYFVSIQGTVVDAGTINAVVGHFSIENRFKEVTVTSMSANVLTAAAINADAITAAKIADDAISSEHLNTGALTADAFAADAIVAATLATGAFTADVFAANALIAATFAASALDGKGDWNTVVPPTEAQMNARTIVSADYVVVGDTIAGVTLVDTTTTNTDMVGTDSAALASAWTATRAGYVDELAAANLPTDIADIPTVAEFEARSIVSADYVVVGDTLARVTLVDTTTTNTDMAGTDNAGTAVELAKVPKSDSNVTFNATALASINAEVVDTLNVDTYAEPGQEAPPHTTTLANKISYNYKALINKKTQTSTEFDLFDNTGATVDQKSTVSDAAGTATKGELVSGP